MFSATGAGNSIDVSTVGPNRINARLSVGAVVSLTSLAVKMQSSIDDSTWVDITGATFTTVTAANGAPEMISFQLPEATSATAAPPKYVRAYGTLVGTSAAMAVSLIACHKYDGAAGYVATRPTIN